MTQEPQSKNRLARLVHLTLLAGVMASGVLLLLGLVLLFATGQPRPEGPPDPFPRLLAAAPRGDGLSILYLGLLLLMATPPARVATLAVGWAIQGSRRFALVAFAVLGLLTVSMAIGVG